MYICYKVLAVLKGPLLFDYIFCTADLALPNLLNFFQSEICLAKQTILLYDSNH